MLSLSSKAVDSDSDYDSISNELPELPQLPIEYDDYGDELGFKAETSGGNTGSVDSAGVNPTGVDPPPPLPPLPHHPHPLDILVDSASSSRLDSEKELSNEILTTIHNGGGGGGGGQVEGNDAFPDWSAGRDPSASHWSLGPSSESEEGKQTSMIDTDSWGEKND